MDVFKIQTSIDLHGNLAKELRAVLGTMEKIEGKATAVKTHIESWTGAASRALAEIRRVHAALEGLHGIKRRNPFGLASGRNAGGAEAEIKKVKAEVESLTLAFGGMKKASSGLTTRFGNWATRLESAASHAQTLHRALEGAKNASSGLRIPRGGGGGGNGGIRQPRGGGAHGGYGPYVAAGAAPGMIEHALHPGVDLNAEISNYRLSGASPANVRAAVEASYAASSRVPSIGVAENLEMLREVAGETGDDAGARAIISDLAQARAVLGRATGKNSKQDMVRLFKFIGLRGGAIDEKNHRIDVGKFREELDGSTRALVAGQGLITSNDLNQLARQAGPMAKGMSLDDLFAATLASIEDMGGSRTGTSMTAMGRQVLGGIMTGKATKHWKERGLIQGKEDVDWHATKAGGIVVDKPENAIAGYDVLMKQGVKAWVDQIARPAMERAGITDRTKQNAELYQWGGTETSRRLLSLALTGGEQLEAVAERYKKAMGIGGYDKVLAGQDLGTSIEGLKKSLDTLTTSLTNTGGLAGPLNTLATTIASFAESTSKHPIAAEIGTAVGLALAGGAATAGIAAAIAAGFAALPTLAVAIGAGATVTILGALIPWREILPKWMLEPDNQAIVKAQQDLKKANPEDLDTILNRAYKSKRDMLLDPEGHRGQEMLRRDARQRELEQLEKIPPKTDGATQKLGELEGAIGKLAVTASVAGAMIQNAAWASLGGGGSGIQKANFTPGGGGLGGGNGIVPPGITGSDANMLGLISKYESGGRNVMNYIGDRTHTAQGYYQITNSNWRKIAPRLGITAPNAMSASLADQARVARVLLHNGKGIRNWSDYNPRLRGALQRGETYHGPAVPPPPPAPARGEQSVQLHVDGQRLASIMTRHQFRSGNRPATGANIADMSEIYPVVG
jgi:hypothetical protein